jgi:anti-sigma regulatory factor (Ser/Thr protein kinase)
MSDSLRFGIRLPAHPLSVGVARAVVRSLSRSLGSHNADSAELLLSELVTNSIRHGSPAPDDPVEIELVLRDGHMSGSVCDRGPLFDHPAEQPQPGQVGGFGLHIAAKLGDLTIQRTDRGNQVTFSLPFGL